MQYTEDSIWRTDIRVLQPEKGYRFALDAVLLAHFVKSGPEDQLLEIGAGCGVVTILMSKLNRFRSVKAIEIQKELAELCRKNFEFNEIEQAEVHEADMRDLSEILPEASFDGIYSNPPYRRAGSGRLNPSSQKAIARHEIKMKLKDLFECAKILLKPAGRLTVILPAFRESDFDKLTSAFHFHPHERKYVHSFADAHPVFFLATVGKSSTGFTEHPPLVIYETPGLYTSELQSLLIAAQ
ncbi:methyltransferase [bacterium]|nr:methyltransferase [bacterium]MCI0602409.1 methyltransferase [bacterium]